MQKTRRRIIKNLAIYKFEKEIKLNKELVEQNIHVELTDLQSENFGFCELYEGTYLEENVQGYSILKVRHSKRKDIKDSTVEREYTRRMEKLSKEGTPFDLDQLLEEVNTDLIRTSEITTKSFMLVVDHVNQCIMVDATRNVAEDSLHLLHKVLKEDVQLEALLPEQAFMQKLLTGYVSNVNSIPDPMVQGYHVEMGYKTEVGKKAKSSNVIIKNEDICGEEVNKHLDSGKVVNKLEIDHDGIIFFKIDNTFFINSIKFEEALKYEEDTDSSASLNFLSEWQLKLPELSKMVSILETELSKVEI